MAESDAALAERVAAGDAAAFEVLMRRHFRMAFLIAFAQLRNKEDADDACQTAFIRCWERMRDCRDYSRIGAWIAVVVRNVAANHRDALRVRDTDPIESGAGVVSAMRADVPAAQAELRERLNTALAELPVVQREIVLLHDLDGWTHPEISVRLELSVTMSRRHLSDARKRLRSILGDYPSLLPDHD